MHLTLHPVKVQGVQMKAPRLVLTSLPGQLYEMEFTSPGMGAEPSCAPGAAAQQAGSHLRKILLCASAGHSGSSFAQPVMWLEICGREERSRRGFQ